ncbi:hypothetical protein C8P66_108134 [Humitalea rosea]|uniref:ArsR family transcriptional regulator n=1 Tax=Humitalea rosea TaxID=990373 RepID=A0A2W7IJ11_9PROT|nr:ArsR family transcriptional regulator [Humitalea rosea]PZW46855.1 hypothetical protein C8P66_108134 [Humitalea rosea]
MTSLAEILAQDRRCVVLRALQEDHDYSLNEDTLRSVLASFGHGVIKRDLIRADLAWLEEQRLLRVEKLAAASGELWIATLTADGAAVAQGAPHPGVARPQPR